MNNIDREKCYFDTKCGNNDCLDCGEKLSNMLLIKNVNINIFKQIINNMCESWEMCHPKPIIDKMIIIDDNSFYWNLDESEIEFNNDLGYNTNELILWWEYFNTAQIDGFDLDVDNNDVGVIYDQIEKYIIDSNKYIRVDDGNIYHYEPIIDGGNKIMANELNAWSCDECGDCDELVFDIVGDNVTMGGIHIHVNGVIVPLPPITIMVSDDVLRKIQKLNSKN